MYLPRVLLIVDSMDIASLDFRQLLDTAGYSTELIACNQVTLEGIKRIQPNVIFFHNSKHELPDNGIIELFQNEQLSEIPMVALTANKEIANLLLPIATVVLLLPVSEQRLINLFSLLGSIDKSVEKFPWDTLTGFYAPSFFRTRLQKALEHSRQLENDRFILYTINLEHLNSKNGKNNGTEYRQRILQGIAQVLQKALRPTDIVSRFDVYQFLVLIEDVVDRFTPATIAGRMYLEFEDYLVDASLQDQVKIDIGIIYCDSEYNSADEILNDAQMALQMAKQDHHSSYKVFVRNRPKSKRVSIQHRVSV
jgi:diguanylate cyclase (GGDEF)-like protein